VFWSLPPLIYRNNLLTKFEKNKCFKPRDTDVFTVLISKIFE